ncbi:glycosyltransferase family 39 protein [Halomicronema hongdechloris]|uniref:glycosyltransferase family 39 protein n=1 Tax=Halomicronema hongdechloris TaxID=1209493 RepID=UPI001651238C|nr:glycosyltransferase family 39 protein [Halomicronema hongdechloris]
MAQASQPPKMGEQAHQSPPESGDLGGQLGATAWQNSSPAVSASGGQGGGKRYGTVALERIAWLIIGVSGAVRVIQYGFNRSLWADEAVLALNIGNRTYTELLKPLDYDQGAPFGFLFLEKLATQILGLNEYALRLFPLLAGLLTLVLFYAMARQYLQGYGILIALIFIGCIDTFVYFSTEVKQYSTDVAIALISFWLAQQTQLKLSTPRAIFIAAAGAIAIWCSHPAVLVLAGVTISLIARHWRQTSTSLTQARPRRRHLTALRRALTYQLLSPSNRIIYLSWLVSFLVFYLVSIQELGSNEVLQASWQSKGAFPEAYHPIATLVWLIERLGLFFHSPLGFASPWEDVSWPGILLPIIRGVLALGAFVVGCVSLARHRGAALLTLLSPVIVTVVAAYLQQYPFAGRLVLFLAPCFIIAMAAGLYHLVNAGSGHGRGIGLVMTVILLSQPLYNTLPLLYRPHLREEIKPVMAYVQAHQQPGDTLYVFQRGIRQFEFYADRYGYEAGEYIAGVDSLDDLDGHQVSAQERTRYINDLNQLRGRSRVWVLFSHAWVEAENQLMLSHLNCLGDRLDSFATVGAFVYLYDLSHAPSNCL